MTIKRTTDEIERNSNRFLEGVLEQLFQVNNLKLRPYRLHALKEKGIDFIFEIEARWNSTETTKLYTPKGLFYIQNKGQDDEIKPLIKRSDKEQISYQLHDVRQIEYFCMELDQPMIITLCDLKNKTIYWCPIQLEADRYIGSIEEIKKAIKNKRRKTPKIQIYFDSNNCLYKNGVIEIKKFSSFLADIMNSKDLLVDRYLVNKDDYFPKDEVGKTKDSKKSKVYDATKVKGYTINQKKPILEQVNDYLSFKFKEVNYVPIQILTLSYPFKKENSFFPYYTTFSLSTDNEELFEFFESIKIEKNGELIFTNKELIKGVKKHKETTRTILTKLSENLIFNLESKKSHKRINIHYRKDQKCDCVVCKFLRFEFSEAFKMLSTIPRNLDKKYKLAYVQYQIGNFLRAENLFSKLDKQSKSKQLYIRQFITQYNLNKLSIFIRDRYWGENAQDPLVDKLKEINLDESFQKLKNADNEKLLDWIRSNSFYSKCRDRIQKTVAKIREHYYSQLQGGWSSNNHIWELINAYAEIDAFLNNNYIIYDRFSEFNELSEVFIEGLFASHAIDKTQNSRLESFDDWLVKKIVFYGKAERILKHFERYGLKEITYKQTSDEGDSFVELLSRFLDGYSKTRRAFYQYCEKNNRYFWDKYNSIFSNLMVMAGISDLKKAQVNEIAGKLLKFLETKKSIYPYNIKYARFFINWKSNLINKSTLKKFLLITIHNDKLHGKDFIEAVAVQIKRHHGEIKLSANDFTGFEKMAFDKCPKCKRKHSANFMVYLYEIISDEKTRDKIKLGIGESLKKKYSTELYYLSAFFGILEAKGDFFELFIQASKPAPNQTSFKSMFTGKDEIRNPNLNMLINLCYKYDIDLGKKQFEDFKGIDTYYDWLLDMKDFDYSLFNPKWVCEYQTPYYFKEIRKHKIIQEKICKYLKDNRDLQLERDYIDLFCDDKG